jgi:outer membrane cobalamin receptor
VTGFLALAVALLPLKGLRLDDAISLLQRQGLVIIYSTSLVTSEMRVDREPQAPTLRGKLEEILAAHNLRVMEGPRKELLVVAAPKPPPPPAAPPPIKPQAEPQFGDEIVVRPGLTPRIPDEPVAPAQSLSREAIKRSANAIGDVTRILQHLTGVAGSEASATLHIRGGAPEDTLIALDGLELSEPFHLRDFFNIFSTLDSSVMGHVGLMTGSFPAEWGDHMGGVVDLSLLAPSGSQWSSLTFGTLDSGFTAAGQTTGQDTNWLLTARDWYPDVVLNVDKDPTELINTDCYDLLGKVEHRFTPRTTASFTVLDSLDNLGYHNVHPGETDNSHAKETSSHAWLTTQTNWSDSTSVRSILAAGRLWRDREGSIAGGDALQISDTRGFNFVEVKQDWRAGLLERQQIRAGFDAKTSDARYDYMRSGGDALAVDAPAVDTHLHPHEKSLGFYASDRIQLTSTAVAELGLRRDRQSIDDRPQLSPRLNVAWAITPSSNLRLGWGRYYQSQRLNELQVEDGVTGLASPERAEHRTVSFEHRFADGLNMSIEAVDKPMTNVRPRFENMLNPIDVFPEAENDRVRIAPQRSRASGVDVRLAGKAAANTAWWFGYTRSRAVDTIDGRDVPRAWDQPHAASGGLNVEVRYGWTANFAAAYHTGWPTTPMFAVRTADGIDVVPGQRNSERLPPWFRLDARLTKLIRARTGTLALTLDVINATDHRNVCCISDVSAIEENDGALGVTRQERSLVPVFPTLTARWQF